MTFGVKATFGHNVTIESTRGELSTGRVYG
jgi:hypothetical protein